MTKKNFSPLIEQSFIDFSKLERVTIQTKNIFQNQNLFNYSINDKLSKKNRKISLKSLILPSNKEIQGSFYLSQYYQIQTPNSNYFISLIQIPKLYFNSFSKDEFCYSFLNLTQIPQIITESNLEDQFVFSKLKLIRNSLLQLRPSGVYLDSKRLTSSYYNKNYLDDTNLVNKILERIN